MASVQIQPQQDGHATLPPFRHPVNTAFQSDALFSHMTVARILGQALEVRRGVKPGINAIATLIILASVVIAGLGLWLSSRKSD